MIPQPIKDFIRMLLVVLLPVFFVVVKKTFPDFPLSQDTFVNLIIWAIGLLVGGWQLAFLSFKTDFLNTGKRWIKNCHETSTRWLNVDKR